MKKQTWAYVGLFLIIIIVGVLIWWIAKRISALKLGRKAKLEVQLRNKPLPKWKTMEKPWLVSTNKKSEINDPSKKFVPSEKTIFVLIVSRPGQINRTTSFISHAIETSTQPNRLRFGVVCAEPTTGTTQLQRFDSFWKQVLKHLKKTTLHYRNNTIEESLRNNVKVTFLEKQWISAYHAVGVAEQTLYKNEHFIMYVENWIGLAPGWDNDCTFLVTTITNTSPILTHPPVAKEIDAGANVPASFYAFKRWSLQGIPLFSQKSCVSLAKKCYRGLKRTPEFAFSSSDILSSVNHYTHDLNLVPDRDWSWGITVKCVYHEWIPHVPPKALVYYRFNPLLESYSQKINYKGIVSLQTQYSKITNDTLGINPQNKKVHDYAEKGITPQLNLPTDQIATWYGDMDTYTKSHG